MAQAMASASIIEEADSAAIAAWLADRLARALAANPGEVAIAIPGGSTPFPILAALAGHGLDWPRLAIWPTDERLVGEDHPASNIGRIRAALAPLGARVVALDAASRPPHFALVWLGMGEDGHIASLFPNTDPRADDAQRVRQITPDPLPPEAPFARASLTMPALLASDELLFVMRGAAKRALFAAAMKGENDLPVARLLSAARQPVTCFT